METKKHKRMNTDKTNKVRPTQCTNYAYGFLCGRIHVGTRTSGRQIRSQGRKDTVTYIPGPGILSAMNEKMTNAQWNHYSTGQSHPGRSAQTPLYDVAIQATSEILQGAEVFLSYGANYDDANNADNLERSDYDKLDETIKKMLNFFSKYEDEDETNQNK
jgi:hypothetical protein